MRTITEEDGVTDTHIQDWITKRGFVLNPTVRVLRSLADTVTEENGRVNVLLRKPVARHLDREYTTASRLEELDRQGIVAFRILPDSYQPNIVVTDTAVGSFVEFNATSFAVGSTNEELIDDLLPAVEFLWDDNEPTDLLMPADDEFKDALLSTFPETVYNDFHQAIEVMEEIAYSDLVNPTEPLFTDRAHIYASLLLVGARNGLLLRELGNVVETVGLANRATLSREKTRLEESGFITTEHAETSRGRPPLTLLLTDRYRDDDLELLAERVYDGI
jgi:hypothetical protein